MLNASILTDKLSNFFKFPRYDYYSLLKILIDKFIYTNVIEVKDYIYQFYRYGGIKIFVI